MLRLTEVASQSQTFSKRELKTTSQRYLTGWPQAATTAESFLLTGRLYWLLSELIWRGGSDRCVLICRDTHNEKF